jgi:hypothetical protein
MAQCIFSVVVAGSPLRTRTNGTNQAQWPTRDIVGIVFGGLSVVATVVGWPYFWKVGLYLLDCTYYQLDTKLMHNDRK